MKDRFLLIGGLSAALVFSAPACAAPDVEDAAQDKPSELSIEYWIERSKEARFDPGMCMYGYPLAKMGAHEAARRIFERCSQAGNPYAMPWAAWTEENGYDQPPNPVAAAEWDRKLAETGSSLGQFNYGLDLLRGHGVAQDAKLGRAMIDRAAEGGDTTARELAAQGYDPEKVTPPSDRAHYRKPQI